MNGHRLDQLPHELRVLHVNRAIEPEAVNRARALRLARALAGHLRGEVVRHQEEDHVRHERDDDEQDNCPENSPDQVPEHPTPTVDEELIPRKAPIRMSDRRLAFIVLSAKALLLQSEVAEVDLVDG